jgi:DnaA family protein
VNGGADALASPQLPLPVGLADEATFDNFLARPGREAVLSAARGAAAAEPLSFLHGGAEGGKSHILQALCHQRAGSVFLPLGDVAAFAPERVLADLEQASLIALDDAHAIAGRAEWEESLFHLVNRARQAGCPLWLAATRPPADLGVALPDLRSRLAGGLLWALPAPSEEDKLAILRFRAQRRGLQLGEAVARYLVTRGSRSLRDLLACLDRLDTASLQLQRPLTIPLVRSVMGW